MSENESKLEFTELLWLGNWWKKFHGIEILITRIALVN
jgi:hypothetical protein